MTFSLFCQAGYWALNPFFADYGSLLRKFEEVGSDGFE